MIKKSFCTNQKSTHSVEEIHRGLYIYIYKLLCDYVSTRTTAPLKGATLWKVPSGQPRLQQQREKFLAAGKAVGIKVFILFVLNGPCCLLGVAQQKTDSTTIWQTPPTTWLAWSTSPVSSWYQTPAARRTCFCESWLHAPTSWPSLSAIVIKIPGQSETIAKKNTNKQTKNTNRARPPQFPKSGTREAYLHYKRKRGEEKPGRVATDMFPLEFARVQLKNKTTFVKPFGRHAEDEPSWPKQQPGAPKSEPSFWHASLQTSFWSRHLRYFCNVTWPWTQDWQSTWQPLEASLLHSKPATPSKLETLTRDWWHHVATVSFSKSLMGWVLETWSGPRSLNTQKHLHEHGPARCCKTKSEVLYPNLPSRASHAHLSGLCAATKMPWKLPFPIHNKAQQSHPTKGQAPKWSAPALISWLPPGSWEQSCVPLPMSACLKTAFSSYEVACAVHPPCHTFWRPCCWISAGQTKRQRLVRSLGQS